MIFSIIFLILAITVSIIIISKSLDEFCIESFLLGTMLGTMVTILVGLVVTSIFTINFAYNKDEYKIASQSTYSLVQQNFDNEEYFLKETTSGVIRYEFEYAIAETGKRINTNKNIVVNYDKNEKPKVVVERYEPSGFLRFFTFAGDKDCYYITLNNTDNLYMLMEWDNK